MALTVPSVISDYLAEVEQDKKPVNEVELYSKLNQQLPKDGTYTQDERLGLWAELNAFQFAPYASGQTPWDTYFGPMATMERNNGTPVYLPDATEITPEILEHWKRRAQQSPHPTFKARYADLVWEFSRLVPPYKRDNTYAQIAGDAYLSAVTNGMTEDEWHEWKFIERAIELSLQIKDQGRIEEAKKVLFDTYRRRFGAGENFMWWQLADTASNRKGLVLSEVEQQEIITSLEKALEICSDDSNAQFDPHQATNAATRLSDYYTRLQKKEDVKRVVLTAGKVFETVAAQASGMLAVAWLEDVLRNYRAAGLTVDAARVERVIQQRGADAQGELKRIEVPVEINRQELEAHLDELVAGAFDIALKRIAMTFLLKRDSLEKTLVNIAKTAPIMVHIPVSIHNHQGHTTARVGSLKDDLDGRVIHQASNTLGFKAAFLNGAFERLKTKHEVTADTIVGFLEKADFITVDHIPFLKDGISAWLSGDHVKAIHVLVPQVEAILRVVARNMGVPILKPNKNGGFDAIGMSTILHHDIFKQYFDKDTRLHLIALYADPRGLNLRNELAHGLIRYDRLDAGLSQWVVHTLLFLAMLKGQATPPEPNV